MAGSIRQFDNAGVSGTGSKTQTFFEQGDPIGENFPDIIAGDTLVLCWSAPGGNTLNSITDDFGNTWEKIPNACISNGSYDCEFWWAQNVASDHNSPTGIALTFSFNGTLTDTQAGGAEVDIYDCIGLNGATVAAATNTITAAGGFSGPTLNGGSGAVYFTGLSGSPVVDTGDVTVNGPWQLEDTSAYLVSSGARAAAFQAATFSGVVAGIAFIGGSQGTGPSGGSLPFLGSIVEVGSVPSGKTNPFLGTFKIVSAAPGGQAVGQPGNPYLGHIVVVENPPAGYNGPNSVLGEVVVIGSTPAGALDPWLGSAETE